MVFSWWQKKTVLLNDKDILDNNYNKPFFYPAIDVTRSVKLSGDAFKNCFYS